MARQMSAQFKAMEVLKNLAKSQGLSLEPDAMNSIKAAVSNSVQSTEVDSVLRMLHKPHSVMMKICKRCGGKFATNYCSVGYCTDECRGAALRSIGIVYDPYAKSEEEESKMYNAGTARHGIQVMWRYEPPELISTETLEQLVEVFKLFLADYDRLSNLAKQNKQEILQAPQEVAPTIPLEDDESEQVEQVHEFPQVDLLLKDNDPPLTSPLDMQYTLEEEVDFDALFHAL